MYFEVTLIICILTGIGTAEIVLYALEQTFGIVEDED